MAVETALIEAANGNFGLTFMAVVVLFFMGLVAAFVRWVMQTMPKQMQADREAYVSQMQKDRESSNAQMQANTEAITTQMQADTMAICTELGRIKADMRDNTCDIRETLEKHDEQAKTILQIDQRIETTLANRPCIAK